MSIFLHKDSRNVTTVGSSAEFKTGQIDGLLQHFIVRANTPSTIFDVTFYDDDDVILLERNDVDGEINEMFQMPVKGSYTVSIKNATNDEVFRVYLAIREI